MKININFSIYSLIYIRKKVNLIHKSFFYVLNNAIFISNQYYYNNSYC